MCHFVNCARKPIFMMEIGTVSAFSKETTLAYYCAYHALVMGKVFADKGELIEIWRSE